MDSEEKIAKESWYVNLSVTRTIFAVFGFFLAVFTGGCSLFSSGALIFGPKLNFSDPYSNLIVVSTIIGFALTLTGAFIWWLAAKFGRPPEV